MEKRKADKYEKAARIIFFEWLKRNKKINGKVHFTKNQFDNIDAQLTANTTITCDVELKIRNYSGTTGTFEGLTDCIMDARKYNSLMQAPNDIKLYVAIWPMYGVMVIWNLNKIDISSVPQGLRFVTDSDMSGRIKKVYNKKYYLPMGLGKKYWVKDIMDKKGISLN